MIKLNGEAYSIQGRNLLYTLPKIDCLVLNRQGCELLKNCLSEAAHPSRNGIGSHWSLFHLSVHSSDRRKFVSTSVAKNRLSRVKLFSMEKEIDGCPNNLCFA